MSEQRNVKVFISWSGDLAREVAVALRAWLPILFDRVEPWASDTDIDAGQRGLAQIEAELSDTLFGIVVVTADNQHAPWLNFEAGALSRVVQDEEHRVVPLLVDLDGPSQLTGPLSQFQAKAADRPGVLGLLRSLGAVAGIGEEVIVARFEAYWPRLEESIAKVTADAKVKGDPAPPRRDPDDVLDEILQHVRQLRWDSEPTLAPTQRNAKRRVQSTGDMLGTLATAHGLEVFEFTRPAPKSLSVSVSPKGEFSQVAVDEFTHEVRKRLPGVDVQVEGMPF